MRNIVLRLAVALAWLWAGAALAPAADSPPSSGNVATSAVSAAFTGKAGTFANEEIKVGDDTRVYRLLVPDTVDLSKPAPIVFAFHGMGEDNKDHMAAITGLNELAAEHKFIIVYPAAAAEMIPNTGLVKTWAMTPDGARNDLAFFDALLAKLQGQYRIDPQRIYLTGMSNGAYFAHLLARERADKIAAVAAHSGELGQFDLGRIILNRKFPVLIIHGAADPIFPVDIARRARDDYTDAGHFVKYIEIPDWPHQWDPRVDEQIWDFFSSHPLNAPTGVKPLVAMPAKTDPAATTPASGPPAAATPHP